MQGELERTQQARLKALDVALAQALNNSGGIKGHSSPSHISTLDILNEAQRITKWILTGERFG